MALNFRCTFEDIEDACIAEYAADRVFKCVAVAAMDLQGVVGGTKALFGEELLDCTFVSQSGSIPLFFFQVDFTFQ